MGVRSLVLAMAVLATGCAHTLPSDNAVAFKTIASANRDSFQALAKSESDAVTVFVRHRLQDGNGTVEYRNCMQAPPPEAASLPCTVVWTSRAGTQLELAPTAANTRALIGALADYGDEMATLAEAKDLTEAQASVDGVGTAVKALATAAGVAPIAGVVIDAAVWLEKGHMIDKRRRALLQAATKADPAVQKVAVLMGEISTHLRNNLQTTADNRLADAYLVMGIADNVGGSLPRGSGGGSAPAASSEARTAAFADMVQAAQDMQAARGISTDYSSLAAAHTKLLAALANPRGSTADALADLKTFLGLLKAAETATKGK